MNIEKLLLKAGVPAVDIPGALASFTRSKKTASKLSKHKWLAPIATIPLLWGLDWDAEELSKKNDIYGNDDSINGDRSGWIRVSGVGVRMPSPHTDTYIQYSEEKDGLEDRPARELVYWGYNWIWKLYEKCGGKIHPRNNFVRWWWIGLRNRASRAFLLAGPEAVADIDSIEHWKASGRKQSVEVYRMGDHWQLIEKTSIVGHLGYRRNIGYKIENVVGSKKPRAMVIWTPFAPAKID